MIKTTARWFATTILLIAGIVALYLGAALAGAYIGAGKPAHADTPSRPHTVFLIMGTLHADFAIQTTPQLLERFSFLRQSTLPLDHPNLRYLTFGWGSKAFYTTAGSYSDITVAAATRAITGDEAVLRVVGFGDVAKMTGTIAIDLSDEQFERLLSFIRTSFAGDQPEQMTGESIGQGDAFYPANGHFNIFHPCNQWVNEALAYAGIRLGVWTPTTYSLSRSIKYFSH